MGSPMGRPTNVSWDNLLDDPTSPEMTHDITHGLIHGIYIDPRDIKCAMGRPLERIMACDAVGVAPLDVP